MLSRVTATNVGDVFLRHTVYTDIQTCRMWKRTRKNPGRKNSIFTI